MNNIPAYVPATICDVCTAAVVRGSACQTCADLHADREREALTLELTSGRGLRRLVEIIVSIARAEREMTLPHVEMRQGRSDATPIMGAIAGQQGRIRTVRGVDYIVPATAHWADWSDDDAVVHHGVRVADDV